MGSATPSIPPTAASAVPTVTQAAIPPGVDSALAPPPTRLPRLDRTGQDRTGQDKIRVDKTGVDSAGHPLAAAADDVAAKPAGPPAPISTGKHPGGLFQSAPDAQCQPEYVLSPGRHQTAPLTAQRLDSPVICFDGFPADRTTTVHLSGPGGVTRDYRSTATTFGQELPDIVFTLEMPLGTWNLRATAPGVGAATPTIRVGRAPSPIFHRTTGSGPTGGPGLTAELAGFPPRTRLDVFLYGPPPRVAFVRGLPVVTTDANGEAHYVVSAEPADPPGTYGVWLDACRVVGYPVACTTYQK
jgi:hypothetical protein